MIPMMTVIAREVTSPYGAPYADPMIFHVPLGLRHSEKAILKHIARERFDDIGPTYFEAHTPKMVRKMIRQGMSIMFAFNGEHDAILDHRT
jgi:hypothetical protein